MRSNYKPLGKYIRLVEERNTRLEDLPLMGLSVSKVFFPTIANLVGTDMSTYKMVYKNQFTYIADTSRRGDKIAIALSEDFDKMLVSQAYTPFEVKDAEELLPEYLMMWFRRPEFDRYARFMSHGSAREIFSWEEMCNTLLPVPSPAKQKEIVKEYNTIVNRINLNKQLIQKLEETAQAIYRQWFVEFEFPDENGKPYKSNGGMMVLDEYLGKEIPIEFKLVKLEEIVDKDSPITYGVVTPGPQDTNGPLLVRGGDLQDGEIVHSGLRSITEIVSNQHRRTILKGGEILISIVGDIGSIGTVPNRLKGANIYRQIAMLRVSKKTAALYLKTTLVSSAGQKLLHEKIQGSVQEVINLEDLRNIKIVMPSDLILKAYFSIAKPLDKRKRILFDLNINLVLLKDLLLSRLATI